MASEFANTFLDRMIRETSDEPRQETKAELIKVTREIPIQKQKKPKSPPPPQVEEVEYEEETEEELDEDFAEKALSYAGVVLKTVKKTFETAKQRDIVLEALYSALRLHFKTKGNQLIEEDLRSSPVGVSESLPARVASPAIPADKTNIRPEGMMSEADWMKIPTLSYADYTNIDIAAIEAEAGKAETAAMIRQPANPVTPIAPALPTRATNEKYDPSKVAAPVVTNGNGQPTLDVSAMSAESIRALKVLAGVK